MSRSHIPIAESDGPTVRAYGAYRPLLGPKETLKEHDMREWQKPTIDETESGMEVTSYLPAELDRA